jgi:tripartite-type tricarboxylate transporter receptor subunit TctC
MNKRSIHVLPTSVKLICYRHTGAPTLMQHIEAGKLRALAVSGSTRLKAAPTVPTVAESGYPGFEAFP